MLLTRDQLAKSAYYCAANTDLQPLLRFGAIVNDFVYVTSYQSRREFLDGLNAFVQNIGPELERWNAALSIESINEIAITEIEHPGSHHLLFQRPEYLDDAQWQDYMHAFSEAMFGLEQFHYEVVFNFRTGKREKKLRLFHLTGEALATYEVLYRRQGIAPLIFISIQSGQIELPHAFMNRLFNADAVTPDLWVRGGARRAEGEWNEAVYDARDRRIFDASPPYDLMVGEFRTWKVHGSGNEQRIVRSFGKRDKWQDRNEVVMEAEGLRIRKLNRDLVRTPDPAYSMEPLYVAWTKPEALLEAIHRYHNDHPEATICRVACLSIGYEGFEHMIEQFVADHRPIEGLQVEIDIHYRWKADLWRRLGE
jgi:hypothetical protein